MAAKLALPSFAQGYAHSRGESAFPELWNGLAAALVPALGPTGSTLFDVSGHGNHGTLTSMDPATDWVVGEKGYALDFDGTDDHVPTADIAVGENFSLVALVKKDTSGAQTIIGELDSGAAQSNFHFRVGHNAGFSVSGAFQEVAVPDLSLATWHHVVLTYDGATVSYYLDGAFNISAAKTGVPDDPGTPATIGRLGDFSGQYWDGQIAQVLVYDRTLLLNNIQQLYVDPLAFLRLNRRVTFMVPTATKDLEWRVPEWSMPLPAREVVSY